MRKIVFTLCAALLLLAACKGRQDAPVIETPEAKAARMEWFSQAKLGIFIHWGIYSRGDWSESWAFHNGTVSMEDYFAQEADFTAEAGCAAKARASGCAAEAGTAGCAAKAREIT